MKGESKRMCWPTFGTLLATVCVYHSWLMLIPQLFQCTPEGIRSITQPHMEIRGNSNANMVTRAGSETLFYSYCEIFIAKQTLWRYACTPQLQTHHVIHTRFSVSKEVCWWLVLAWRWWEHTPSNGTDTFSHVERSGLKLVVWKLTKCVPSHAGTCWVRNVDPKYILD